MEECKNHLEYQAKRELIQLEAMEKLLKLDPDPVMKLEVNGPYTHGFSSAVKNKILEAVAQEKREIKKAIKGRPNKWI